MIFGCHNVIMSNQSTFVLGYLLLQGYDVSGHAYVLRVISLLIGMGICMAVFYKSPAHLYTHSICLSYSCSILPKTNHFHKYFKTVPLSTNNYLR